MDGVVTTIERELKSRFDPDLIDYKYSEYTKTHTFTIISDTGEPDMYVVYDEEDNTITVSIPVTQEFLVENVFEGEDEETFNELMNKLYDILDTIKEVDMGQYSLGLSLETFTNHAYNIEYGVIYLNINIKVGTGVSYYNIFISAIEGGVDTFFPILEKEYPNEINELLDIVDELNGYYGEVTSY